MSLLHKRTPVPGLLPIPPFADTATVVQTFPYPSTVDGNQAVVVMGFFARDLSIVEISIWTQGTVFGTPALLPAVALQANLFNRDRVVVPNGAEWWAIATAPPPPAFEIDTLLRVRWRLHI